MRRKKTRADILADQAQQMFGQMETIPVSAVPKLRALLESANDEALTIVVQRKIKFCHSIAQRILDERKAKRAKA